MCVGMTDFEKICSFDNIYQSFLNIKKGRSLKAECIHFEANLSYNLARLQESLIDGTYRMQGYYRFIVKEPKSREIFAARFVDKVVMNLICEQVLIPRLTPHLINDNVACQKNQGVHFGIRRFTEFLRWHYRRYGTGGYVLKCDISKYFASVSHEVLRLKLAKRIKDSNVLALLDVIIDSYNEISGTPGLGIPIGNNTSQWFALYYLSELDHFVKEQLGIKGYIRYMDDFLLLHHDKGYLWECFMKTEEIVNADLRLRLNIKTNVFPVAHGVEFLGWKFFLRDSGKVDRRLKLQSKKRYKVALHILEHEYAGGSKDLKKVKQILASHRGHLIHGHAFLLEKRAMKRFVLNKKTD